MMKRPQEILTLVICAIGLALPRTVAAEWAGFAHRPLLHGAIDAAPLPGAPAGPQIRPQYVEVPAYGIDAPTYHWGYFGAHPGAQGSKHRGYYGNYHQWIFRFAD